MAGWISRKGYDPHICIERSVGWLSVLSFSLNLPFWWNFFAKIMNIERHIDLMLIFVTRYVLNYMDSSLLCVLCKFQTKCDGRYRIEFNCIASELDVTTFSNIVFILISHLNSCTEMHCGKQVIRYRGKFRPFGCLFCLCIRNDLASDYIFFEDLSVTNTVHQEMDSLTALLCKYAQ